MLRRYGIRIWLWNWILDIILYYKIGWAARLPCDQYSSDWFAGTTDSAEELDRLVIYFLGFVWEEIVLSGYDPLIYL